MSYNVIVPKPVQKQLNKLPQKIRDQIVEKLLSFASEEERCRIEAFLSLQLDDLTQPERSLEVIMDSMSDHAQSRGLTPEILESILNNE